MFKRKKKKTGVKTPEYVPFVMKTVEPSKENVAPRHFQRNMIDTKARFDEFVKWHDDLIKMDGAEVYFSVKDGITVIVTTQEWKDYFLGRSNIIPNTKENNND